jgi:ubiquinone/menaquinone biosynthesis C-methylase UbiE
MKEKKQLDSWKSYDKTVGSEGHYYHQQIVLPNSLKLLELNKEKGASLLDLGCGQGILARHLPEKVEYVGVDSSKALIRAAHKYSKHSFILGDVSQPLSVEKKDFSHVVILLALQNIQDPFSVLKNAATHLRRGGKLLIVLNHPCFRIPRQSSWGVDPQKKIQYRRLDRYSSPLQVPIQMRPSQKELSEETWSYHYPLSTYSEWLKKAGFLIKQLDEWCSNKKSMGKMAAIEDRARQEFPLFLAILSVRA